MTGPGPATGPEQIRNEWLAHSLSTDPADRQAAEAAITELYRLIGADPPRFVWVDSPGAAVDSVPPGQTLHLRAADLPWAFRDWPPASRIASEVAALRWRMDRRIGQPWSLAWWQRNAVPLTSAVEVDPREGTLFPDVLNAHIRDSLRFTVRDQIFAPLRAVLRDAVGESLGIGWYGQHDAYWVAYYDAYRRLRRAHFSPADERQLDVWAALARSCGWWWPYDGLCVIAERPAAVHAEAMPATAHGERRLHNPRGMAVQYVDGWGVHMWNGTRVPSWVVHDPTVERIAAETNVEVRRCAIERIGWDAYIDQAGLSLVATAADPGNPGGDLRLYDMPVEVWGAPARVLLTVNGSAERDGTRRRYGLSVPASIDDPVSAAGWSYGLTGAQYAQLARRT